VILSPSFIATALLLTASVAFSIGVTSYAFFKIQTQSVTSEIINDRRRDCEVEQLPILAFTTKLLRKSTDNNEKADEGDRNYFSCSAQLDEGDGSEDDSEDDKSSDDGSDDNGKSGSLPNQPCQHIYLDAKGVEPSFLSSQDRLVQAIYDLVSIAQPQLDTLVSSLCHSVLNGGVWCAALITDSRITITTAPAQNTLFLDIFACGKNDVFEIFSVVKEQFAPPPSHANQPRIETIWGIRLRGIRHDDDTQIAPHLFLLDQDLGGLATAGPLFKPEVIVSQTTVFQRVDIVETPPTYEFTSRSRLIKDVELDLLNSAYPRERLLFLDGVQQSSLYGDAAYHEALVHPAMIAHTNPKRVAIIGGGEGATLREVLKHKSVEQVVMVEIDGELIELCSQYLPEWNTCDDIQGSKGSCFDDVRARVDVRDAFAWFMDSFGDANDLKEQQFDVIVMDALDPDKFVGLVGDLYKNTLFVESLYNALNEGGTFVVQLGETDYLDDPPYESSAPDTAIMLDTIKSVGFESLVNYEEAHCWFGAPWTFLAGFKNYNSRSRWYRNAAEIEADVHSRILRTKSGVPPLRYFDGEMMATILRTSSAVEVSFCRSPDPPWECTEYDWFDIPLASNALYIPASTLSVLERRNEEELSKLATSPNYNSDLMGGRYIALTENGTASERSTLLAEKISNGRAPVYSPVFERRSKSILASLL